MTERELPAAGVDAAPGPVGDAHMDATGDGDASGGDAAPQGDGDESLTSFLRELPILIIVAFVLAFLLRTFVVQVFYIPSSSMEPTLQVNDRILVDKVTYRFRDIHRGEVVVFEGEDTIVDDDRSAIGRVVRGLGQLIGLAPANARDFVKRVIGLPGDTIRIDGEGGVFVNGEPLDEPYVSTPDPGPYGPVTVPEGKLFFLGDNRPNSSDSRESLGFVDRDHVVGKAFLVIWPLPRFQLLHTADYENVASLPVDGAALPVVGPGWHHVHVPEPAA